MCIGRDSSALIAQSRYCVFCCFFGNLQKYKASKAYGYVKGCILSGFFSCLVLLLVAAKQSTSVVSAGL